MISAIFKDSQRFSKLLQTCPAVDAITKDRAQGVNVPNWEENVETAHLED